MARYHRPDTFTQQTATAHNGQLTGHNHPAATANPDQLATIKPATIGHARQTLGLPFRKPKKRPEGPLNLLEFDNPCHFLAVGRICNQWDIFRPTSATPVTVTAMLICFAQLNTFTGRKRGCIWPNN